MQKRKPTNIILKFRDNICRLIDENSRLCLLLVLLFTIIFAPGFSFLRFDYGIEAWFRSDDSGLKQFEQFKDQFGNDDQINLLIKTPESVFHKSYLKQLRNLENDLWKIKGIKRVDSMLSYPHIFFDTKAAPGEDRIKVSELYKYYSPFTPESLNDFSIFVKNHEVISDYLINKAQDVLHFSLKLEGESNKAVNYTPFFLSLEKILKKHQHQFKSYLYGPATAVESFKINAIRDLEIIFPVMVIIILLFLYFIFRNILAVLVPFIVAITTIIITIGIAGYLQFTFNSLSTSVPTILFATSIADSIHIMSTYISNIKNDKYRKNPGYYALQKNFSPILFTSISTAVGFFSLLFSNIEPMRVLGFLCGLGSLIAWLISILIVVPLFKIYYQNSRHQKKSIINKTFDFSLLTTSLLKAPRFSVSIILLISIIAAIIGSKVKIDSNIYSYFHKSTPLYKANQFTNKNFDGLNGVDIVIQAKKRNSLFDQDYLEDMHAFEKWLESRSYIKKLLSVIDFIKPANVAFSQNDASQYKLPENSKDSKNYLLYYNYKMPPGLPMTNIFSVNFDQTRFSILWDIQHSKLALEKGEEIKAYMQKHGIIGYLTGREYLFHGLNRYIVTSFAKSLACALILITIFMIFFLRSYILGLVSLIPNLAPITFVLGLLFLIDATIDIGTVIVASVCFGIAVDDTVHMMFSFKRLNNANYSAKELLHHVFRETGIPVVITTVVLVAGFGCFAFANFIPNSNFGVYSAVMLTIALITDLVFIPSAILLLRNTATKDKIEPTNHTKSKVNDSQTSQS
ncbi:MAG: MMPL family transporter [Bdellovibrionota bacterium]